MKNPRFIHANEILITITDETTGDIFQRQLPIEYIENHNGLILKGEDLNGNSSEIVFFSDAAVGKIKDITGKGPNTSPCEGH